MKPVHVPLQQSAVVPAHQGDSGSAPSLALRSRHRRNVVPGEIEWLIPSVALTLLSAIFALGWIPNYSGVLPALAILPLWLTAAVLLAGVSGFFSMLDSGVRSPIAHIRSVVVENRKALASTALCIVIAGLNMITFMWVKPLLNYAVPFWADPVLARIDHVLFLGHDPWSLLTWMNSTPAAIFYHRGWFALMILTLLIVAPSKPAPDRSALLVTYFVLWSIVGPLIHVLLPAAGPVFYEQLGYGNRFSELRAVPETRAVAHYLWTIYAGAGFGPGSGISAMPSLHVASTTWMVLCFHVVARRWIAPMAVAGLLILLLSISLGWHYAIDGLVGGGATALCYWTLRGFYRNAWDR